MTRDARGPEHEPEFRRAYQDLLLVAHRSKLMQYVDMNDRADVLQQVLVGVWKKWDTICSWEERRRNAYVLRVADNRIASYIKTVRRRRYESLVPDFEYGAAPRTKEDLEFQLAHANPDLWNPELWRAIAKLTTKQRDALLLHYVEQWSIDEIAEAWRSSSGTVKTHLHRAREALRVMLADWAIEQGLASERGS